MKDYQDLIGKIFISIAIIIAGSMIANEIAQGASNIFSGLGSVGTSVRDGLLQIDLPDHLR